MNDKKPGKEFKEEAKPFVEEIREHAVQAYQHMVRIANELDLRVQKTLDNAPRFGITGSSTPTRKKRQEDDQE